MRSSSFIELWDVGVYSFAIDPPNAVLSFLGDGNAPDDVVVVLHDPRLDGDEPDVPRRRARGDAARADGGLLAVHRLIRPAALAGFGAGAGGRSGDGAPVLALSPTRQDPAPGEIIRAEPAMTTSNQPPVPAEPTWQPARPKFRPVALILAWILSAAALLVAAWIVPGAHVNNFWGALAATAVIAVLNALLPPIVAALRLPLMLVLGLLSCSSSTR